MVHKTGSEIHFDFQVEVSKSGCLDFGDLPGGSAKSLPIKLLNRTHATVPIRLVISAVSQHLFILHFHILLDHYKHTY